MTLQWFEWDLTHPWELVPKKASIGGFDIGNDNRMRWWLMAFLTSKLIPKHSNEEKNKSFVRISSKIALISTLNVWDMKWEADWGGKTKKWFSHQSKLSPRNQAWDNTVTTYTYTYTHTYTYTYTYTFTYTYTYTYNIHDRLSSDELSSLNCVQISLTSNFFADKRWNIWVKGWTLLAMRE